MQAHFAKTVPTRNAGAPRVYLICNANVKPPVMCSDHLFHIACKEMFIIGAEIRSVPASPKPVLSVKFMQERYSLYYTSLESGGILG